MSDIHWGYTLADGRPAPTIHIWSAVPNKYPFQYIFAKRLSGPFHIMKRIPAKDNYTGPGKTWVGKNYERVASFKTLEAAKAAWRFL